MRVHSPSSSSASPSHLSLLLSTPPPGHHGEGQDNGAGTREEGNGAVKGKKTNWGSSSLSALPLGWIQGDWIRSSLRQEDLEELAESELIANDAARLPEGETEPQPRPGECVLLATHIDRGFSLPPHPFSGVF